jgi:hypothetical protein
MGKDSSLDDFLGGSDEPDDSQPADEPDADDSQPALETADWSPDGAECASCGAVVERRWRQGEELVCSTCKGW